MPRELKLLRCHPWHFIHSSVLNCPLPNIASHGIACWQLVERMLLFAAAAAAAAATAAAAAAPAPAPTTAAAAAAPPPRGPDAVHWCCCPPAARAAPVNAAAACLLPSQSLSDSESLARICTNADTVPVWDANGDTHRAVIMALNQRSSWELREATGDRIHQLMIYFDGSRTRLRTKQFNRHSW